MTLSDLQVQVLTEQGLIKEEGSDAEKIYAGLDDAGRAGVDTGARDLGMVNSVVGRLMGTEENPGMLQSTLTGILDKHTAAIDQTLEKTIHEKLDQRGVPPSPQHKPPPKGTPKPPAKPGDVPPLPEGAVSQEEYDVLKQQFHGSQIGNAVVGSLGEAKFVNGEARQDAVDHLTRHAKIGDDGKVTIEMEVLNTNTKKRELRTMTPEVALQALQGTKPHLFTADAVGGSGGGGGDASLGGGSGTDALPAVESYAALLENPKLMHQYMTEKPDEFRAMKETHFAGENGELANVLSGKGLSASGLVNKTLEQLRARTIGVPRQ